MCIRDRSNTLTGADGLYNGRSVSRQNQPGNKDSVEIWRVCASAVDGLPLYWAILRFLVKGIWWRGCAASFRAGLFSIRNSCQTGRAQWLPRRLKRIGQSSNPALGSYVRGNSSRRWRWICLRHSFVTFSCSAKSGHFANRKQQIVLF